MKIAVGSTNPVKVNAVKRVMNKVYKNVEVIPLKVESKVSNTPLSDKEMIEGAKNRAYRALEKTDSDLAVGMEGGLVKIEDRYFLCGWTVVMDRKGKIGMGGGIGVEIPGWIVNQVKQGKELGKIMDEIRGEKDTKKKDGVVGFLTNGLIPRQKAWEISLIFALTKFLKPEFYENE